MKRILKILIVLCVLSLAGIYLSNRAISKSASGKLYSNINEIPYNRVGLLLGTSKYVGTNKRENLYNFRIEATAQLIRSAKIKYLIISGDNGRDNYNEPALMRSDLINLGIYSSIIYLDYAGFRTFD